jgi:hypothetical protein
MKASTANRTSTARDIPSRRASSVIILYVDSRTDIARGLGFSSSLIQQLQYDDGEALGVARQGSMIQHAPTQAARLHLESRLVVFHCYVHGNNVGRIVKALEPISRTFHNFLGKVLPRSWPPAVPCNLRTA